MLNDNEKNRYARHLLLPEFGEEAQLRLKNSKVLLVGAGGLGSPVALYLTAAGIGHLTIIDADKVELSNLQRQILHDETSLGTTKVKSAHKRLTALNSDTTINLIEDSFNLNNAQDLVEEHDLIIDGSDNFPTRFLVNDACYFSEKPLVYGSIFQYEGQLTLFNPKKKGPCYRCIVPEVPEDGAVPNCLEAGVIGTLPGIIGSLQSMEAIKYLSGIGTPMVGKMLYYNALQTEFRNITLHPDPQCPLCSKSASLRELKEIHASTCQSNQKVSSITAKELRTLITNDTNIFLMDVREADEFAVYRIPTSQLIPLSSLEEHIMKIPRDQTIYVHCQSGVRSLKAIKILQKHHFDQLINISDGINGW